MSSAKGYIGLDDVRDHARHVVRCAGLEGQPDQRVSGGYQVGVCDERVPKRVVANDARQAVAAHEDPVTAAHLDQLEVQLGLASPCRVRKIIDRAG